MKNARPWCALAIGLGLTLAFPGPALADSGAFVLSPINNFTGFATTVTANIIITTGAGNGRYVVDYGDGSPQTLPAGPFGPGPQSLTGAHSYVAPGTYALKVINVTSGVTIATGTTTIVTPVATVTAMPANALAAQPVTLMVTTNAIAGLPAEPFALDFGDGSSQSTGFASGSFAHAYTTPGLYTVRYTTTSANFPFIPAQTTVNIGTLAASLAAVPAATLAGSNVGFSVMLSTSNGAATVPVTLQFGDGMKATVAASGTVTHAYALPGSYPALVVGPNNAVLARALVSVGVETAALTISPPAVLVNAPISFAVALSTSNGLPAPPVTLSFGDGAQTQVAASGSFTHSYALAGNYTARITSASGALLSTGSVGVGVESGTIAAQQPNPIVGTPTNFNVALFAPGGIVPPAAIVSFGDGTTVTVPASGVVTHTYTTAGPFTVTLQSATGIALAATTVTALQSAPALPIGQIFSVTPLISPVLAGSDTTIAVSYRITTPIYSTNAGALQVIVDLLDPQGVLIRRADPFTLPYNAFAGSNVQTAIINYSVPVDAGGTYALRISIVGVNGGNVATYAPVRFLITGGPDPAPKITNQFHGNGALEAGPKAGSSGNNLNMGLTTALIFPTSQLDASGLFDPISKRSDPLLSFHPAVAGPVPSPDQQTQPSVSDRYKYVYGRTQSLLPSLLGGSTTLRGVDAEFKESGAIFHAGYGYTTLGSTSTNAQLGTVVDVGKSLNSRASILAGIFHRQDSTSNFNATAGGPGGAISGTGEALELNQTIGSYVKLQALGGLSSSQSFTLGGPVTNDSSNKFIASYQHATTSVTFDYHNTGPVFATGAGPSSLNDRVGFTALAQLSLSPIANMQLGWTRDDARSAFSRQTDASVGFNLSPAHLPQISLGLRRDRQLASTANGTTNQVTANLSQPLAGGALSLALNDAATSDAFNAAIGAVSRTESLQYQVQHGSHAFGIGLNAATVAGGAPNSSVAESITYGFPFGGRVRPDGSGGFELRLEANNTSLHAIGSGTSDAVFGGIFSYHLIKYAALGLRLDVKKHTDAVFPVNSLTSSALRLRLDFQQ